MASAWVFATVSETVLENTSGIEMTMAAGNKSYYPFSVTVATLATSAILIRFGACDASARVTRRVNGET